MLERTRFGSVAVIAAAFALIGLAVPEADAQLNEKRAERQATGKYKGKITSSRVQEKTNGVPDGPFMQVSGGQGKVRVPVKDGKLKSTAKDSEIPANGKAKFTGREKKSDVRRNGKKIIVAANGQMDLVNSGNRKTKGKVTGKIVQRGSKHVADVKFVGERNDIHGTGSTCWKTKVKGRK